MEPVSVSQPTQITIPAPRPEQESSWQDKHVRRHMADRYRGTEIAGTQAEKDYFGEDGLQVSDVLDVINPLHHIPFVSTLYQELTGDTISTAAKIAGGALLGGPIGLIAAVFDTVFTNETGRNVAGSAVAALTGETKTAAAPANTQLASAQKFSEAEYITELYPTSNEEVVRVGAATVSPEIKQAHARYMAQKMAEEKSSVEIILPARKVTATAQTGTMTASAQSDALMDLYGGSQMPAHRAYRDANMLGYLRDASVNAVM